MRTSVGGMVASQCGIPLLPNGLRVHETLAQQVDYLGSITCLGDIYAASGAVPQFVVGSDAVFAGIRQFYEGHGFAPLHDLAALRSAWPEGTTDAAFAGTTLDDAMVFKHAAGVYDRLAADPSLLLLVVETIGPHHDTGVLAAPCSDNGRARLSKDFVAVLACTARLAEDFFAFIQAHGSGRTPAILILSDHLNHNRNLVRAFPRDRRRNTAIFLPGQAGVGAGARAVEAHGSMMDVFPTLLALLDLAPMDARAGLGVSLVGPGPTLVARHGREVLDPLLIRDAALARWLWDGPPPGQVPVEVATGRDR